MKYFVPILSLFFLALSINSAYAHVGYVVGTENFESHKGLDTSFLLSVFSNPFYVILMIVTIIVVLSAYIVLSKNRFVLAWTKKVTTRAEKYDEYVPLLLRLALGSALIGAGSLNETVSPILHGTPFISQIEIVVGFLLLFGLFVPAMAIVCIALYGYAVTQNIYLIGNLDFLTISISLLMVASLPSLDDVLGIPFHTISKKAQELLPLVLRIGIGCAMTFLALYEKILNPHSSALVVQQYHLDHAIPVNAAMWVFSSGMIEIVVGIALLLGFKTRLVATIALLVLTTSFFYFKEGVAAHVSLFAVLVVLFITGPGKKSMDYMLGNKS